MRRRGRAECRAGPPMRDLTVITRWMDAVLSLRLPQGTASEAPPTLLPVDETEGWLGDLKTFLIAPFDCFEGDRLAASWFPTEETARDWQALVSNRSVDTIGACE